MTQAQPAINGSDQPRRRRKDSADLVIGDGKFLSMAYVANDMKTTAGRARAILRHLNVPVMRLGLRIFVDRTKYLNALASLEIDPTAPSRHGRVRRERP